MKMQMHFSVLALALLSLAAPSLWAGPQRLDSEALAALQANGATADEHLKLAAHFQAEAKAFGDQAEVHEVMAKRYNRPNLPARIASLNAGMVRHCLNLSKSLREASKEAEQMAESHKAMAAQLTK